jgi:hypothetical protein
MLETQEDSKPDEHPVEMRDACVARSSAGSDHHNTLKPRWEFAFSV